jgi:hypothetical protein
VPAWCEPQLALAGEQHVPGLMLLPAYQGVLAIGAEPASAPGLLRAQGRLSLQQAQQYSGPPPGWKCQRQRARIRFATFSNTCLSVSS